MSWNINGKVCLVTGATSGIGEVTVRSLARQGARVVLAGRNRERTEALVRRIRAESGAEADFLVADLSSQDQVRRLAEEFRSRYDRLDVLINNAGLLNYRRAETADGLEMTFAVNHIGYFLLTDLLLDLLKASAPSRVINISSNAHRRGRMNWDDLQFRRRYSLWGAYAQSKLANLLFTFELARRLDGTGVTVNAVHPGYVKTGFAMNTEVPAFRAIKGAIDLFFAITPEEGADTMIYMATSPEVEGVTGKYYVRRRQVRPTAAALDPQAALRLWRISEELTGVVTR